MAEHAIDAGSLSERAYAALAGGNPCDAGLRTGLHRVLGGDIQAMTWRSVAFVILAMLATAFAHAQDLEPRAYGNAPVGLNFLIIGYAHAEGGLVTDPSIPLENPHLEIPTMVAAYARTFGLWSRSAKVAVGVPYAWLSGTADVNGVPQSRVVDGFADPRIGFTINLYGAPAYSL